MFMKRCPKCTQDKSLDEFCGKKKKSCWCKECTRKLSAARRADPEYVSKKKLIDNTYRRRDDVKARRNANPITSWRRIVNNVLRNLGKPKEGYTHDLLGYSASDLKNHIESLFLPGMSWENRGDWHIDHIIPVSSFAPDTPISIINALSNLQPLWAEDNLIKSNKY